MRPLPAHLDTERLRLDRWTVDDAATLRRLLDDNDAHLRPWIPFMQHEPRSLAQTRTWLDDIARGFDAGEAYRYAIRRQGDPAVVGETMLIARGGPDVLEAGYWLDAAHCGRGYAVEATAALLPVAFARPDVARVLLKCDARNRASQATAERLGGARIGDEHIVENGAPVTLWVYEVPRPD